LTVAQGQSIFPHVHCIGAFRTEGADMCLLTAPYPEQLARKKEGFNMFYVRVYSLISKSIGYIIICTKRSVFSTRFGIETSMRQQPRFE
jgi:hypothetical protein